MTRLVQIITHQDKLVALDEKGNLYYLYPIKSKQHPDLYTNEMAIMPIDLEDAMPE